MKTYILIISILLITMASIYPRTYIINQEGTGDFTTITAGIEASESGDTLIVHPGVYYENIDFSGKDIVLTSLYRIESDDRRYVRETVIDGNRQGTVVTIKSGETRDAVLSGFTVRNGEGVDAGGIEIFGFHTSPTIRYCIVENNHATYGVGGIRVVWNSTVNLIGNTIRYNTGGGYGGIVLSGGRDDELCNEELNSVYYNYGAVTCDIHITNIAQSTVIIDTLTVQDPDPFFVRLRPNSIPPDFSITVNHGLMEPIDADLYVSPDGCDNNSGITPEEPLQRISTALMRIKPNRNIRRSIHIAEGIYSRSLNDQSFPVGTRNYIDIVGPDKETTILDGEDKYMLIYGGGSSHFIPHDYKNFSVSNLTLTNGNNGEHNLRGAMQFLDASDFTLENIIITNTHTAEDVRVHFLTYFQSCENYTLRNIDYTNNNIDTVAEAVSNWLLSIHVMQPGETMYAENNRFRSNHSGNIFIKGYHRDPDQPYQVTFANPEISDNINRTDRHYELSAIVLFHGKARMINATMTNNKYYNVDDGAVIGLRSSDRAELSIYNSIFYNNHSRYQVYMVSRPYDIGPDIVNVSHSLIEGGVNGIIDYFDCNIINWGEGNIDADPMFVGEDINPDYPYMLLQYSPARGAGTLDIPDFEFPEFDLAGNPRVVDGQIDMGAYQWHPSEWRKRVKRRETADERHEEYNLRNFPNPAVSLGRIPSARSKASSGERRSTGTTISFEAPDNGNVVIEIYNAKGQFVRRIFDADVSPGEYNVYWDGRDERNRPVATGFYMYQLKFNDQLVATGRCTFIK